jgi:hypothetical protein
MAETKPPPPAASPQPNGVDLFGPEDSQVRQLTVAEAKALLSMQAQRTAKIVTSADVKWFVATMAAVAVASVTGFINLDARAQEKADKAAGEVAKQLEDHKTNEGVRLANVEKTTDRQDRKLDAMLFAFGVPNPAPAPAKDGGR